MNNNHAKVNVLYANARIVDENENLNLQRIANSIAEYFYERGMKTLVEIIKKNNFFLFKVLLENQKKV